MIRIKDNSGPEFEAELQKFLEGVEDSSDEHVSVESTRAQMLLLLNELVALLDHTQLKELAATLAPKIHEFHLSMKKEPVGL